MASTEENPSDLDLILLSTTKHSSSINNWLYMPFLFLSRCVCVHRCVYIHLFYALASSLHLQERQHVSVTSLVAFLHYI